MVYELKEKQKVFIELTNQVHGGPGWEFGSCLWSPEKSKDNKDSWSTMREVAPGDLIIHSLKKRQKGHMFVGSSFASSSYIVTKIEPIIPGRWGGRENYYRVDLEGYSNFNIQIPVKEFLNAYSEELKKYSGSFYAYNLEVAQKYLAEIPRQIFDLLNNYLDKKQIEIKVFDSKNDEIDHGKNKDNVKYEEKRYKELVLTRTVRDSKMIKDLKASVNDVCQVCGKRIQLPNNKAYSEGHHIKPLNGIHDGPDIKENVIILCPNHHVEFDYGLIAINPKTRRLIHVDNNNEIHNKELAYVRTDIEIEYIKYHYNHIFNKF